MEEQAKYIKKKGRAKLDEVEKRTKEIKVRLNQIEEDLIKQKAFASGLSVADFVRKSALDKHINERITPEQAKLFRICSGVANNMNQLAKSVHQEGALNFFDRIEKMINHMQKELYSNE